MIVTIDGPAGAGKSTVARLLADKLEFRFLDTGAMYRAVTWLALKQCIDFGDQEAVAQVAANMTLELDRNQVIVDGVDITDEIRSTRVTQHVSDVADNTLVRQQLVACQREIAANGDYVCEGRDQATVAFPDAECKIYLTASNEERARRRYEQLVATGKNVDYESILKQQTERDKRDMDRTVGGLQKAQDSIEVDTGGMTLVEVVEQVERIARKKMGTKNT